MMKKSLPEYLQCKQGQAPYGGIVVLLRPLCHNQEKFPIINKNLNIQDGAVSYMHFLSINFPSPHTMDNRDTIHIS